MKTVIGPRVLGIFCASLLSLGDGSQAAHYSAAGDKRNSVTFETEAPLESILGRTWAVTASIDADPADLSLAKARFQVDLSTLETGIAMRDQHMKSPQYLDTEKHPLAIFDLSQVKDAVPAEEGKPVEFKAVGTFSLHGVQRKMTAKVRVTFLKESEATRTRLPGNLLRVTAAFTLRLSDYGIRRPEMMLLRVGETVDIKLDLFASSAP